MCQPKERLHLPELHAFIDEPDVTQVSHNRTRAKRRLKRFVFFRKIPHHQYQKRRKKGRIVEIGIRHILCEKSHVFSQACDNLIFVVFGL